MALNEYTINRHQIAREEMHDVSNHNVEYRDFHRFARADNFNSTVIVLLVELVELALHLPVVDSAHHNHNDDGDHDGHALDPFHLGATVGMLNAESLVQSKG